MIKGIPLKTYTYSQLPPDLQSSAVPASTFSIPEVLEKSGYNAAARAHEAAEDLENLSLAALPLDRQKRPYSHTTQGKPPLVRGIESTWAAKAASDKVLKERGINPSTIVV